MKEIVQNKNIYRTATFLKQVLRQSNNFFRIDTFLTKVLFQKRYFFTWRYNTCITIVLLLVQYFISMFFRTATFWKKLIFQKSNISHYLLFLESHFFRVVKTQLSIADTFSQELLFKTYFIRRGTISQLCSLSPAHFLFISQQLSELDNSSIQ